VSDLGHRFHTRIGLVRRFLYRRSIPTAYNGQMRQTGGTKTGVLLPLILGALFFDTSVHAITITTVPVGDVGNSNDPATGNLYGGVNYTYNIGRTEVTTGQYTAFLNAVAATDTYGLYNPSMATDVLVAGVTRSGASGSYSYSVIGSPNHPIAYVSWGNAARFANWLHNGQPTGVQNASTTEDGGYTLNGANSIIALNSVSRNASAKWFIPSENEWYKAAYFQPATLGGDTDSYWKYPMRTNNEPYSDEPPATTPDNTRVGNFDKDDDLVNGYDDGFALTSCNNGENCLTDVGAYSSSPSFYGTFDQGGSTWEWNEGIINTTFRSLRGGSWLHPDSAIASSFRGNSSPTNQLRFTGFRVASIQAPGDFNGDGMVDADDYAVWRKNTGSPADYDLWRSHYGEPATSSGTSLSTGGTVPEPSTFLLLAIGAISLLGYRRKAKS
jgi:formylglycine-generating enzyme